MNNFTTYESPFFPNQNNMGKNENGKNLPLENNPFTSSCDSNSEEESKPDLTANLHMRSWDGTPLQENIIYNLNDMYGLPIARIKENRDAEKRAKASLQTCKENGMGQPAKLIPAPVISEAGFTPEYRNEEGQWVEVPEDKLDQY